MKPILPPNVRVLWGDSQYVEPGYDEYVISKSRDFGGYLGVVQKLNEEFDAVILSGRCGPQAAYLVRPYLRKGGYLIAPNNRPHYRIIESYYDLEKRYVLYVSS